MHTIQIGQTINGFTINNIEEVTEIDGTAYIMNHTTAGTQLLYLDTEDEEIGFAICFRTCPADNTGVFHIIEHSVLCGSDKYPVKNPFVHLLKSSMNTFLNAMTLPDCTIYPVASTNEKDLLNLMSVYLDAVFHPAVLHEPRIFKQEGWHYETDGTNLSVNGVVYNEMKGVLAQPARALTYAFFEELFPDTSYRYNSGGVPSEIETLSYEQFIDSYKRHYTPNNAAIVLYGDLNVNTFLEAIDKQLLSTLDKSDMPSKGAPNVRRIQKPVISTKRKLCKRALPQDAELRFGTVIGEAGNARRVLATQILGHALLGTSESPLKRMLIDTGIASDFSFSIGCHGKLYLTIRARDVKPDSAEAFLEALKIGCQKLHSQGLPKDLLEAAAFNVELTIRTNNGEGRPSAADQMISCLSKWGADGSLDAEAIRYDADLQFLKTAIATDYFDNLLQEVILDNAYYALVELCPTDNEQQNNNEPADRLATSALTTDEIMRIAREAADLKAYQESPDSPDALASIPRLNRSDCLVAPYYAGYKHVRETCFDVLRHEYAENGIAYIVRYYDISSLTLDDLRYVKTLLWIISETDTLRHNASEVIKLKNGRLGLINADVTIGTNMLDESLGAYVRVCICSLGKDIEFVTGFVDEILHETIFTSRSKLRETIERQYQHLKYTLFDSTPHSTALTRATAHIKGCAVLTDTFKGFEAYEFIKTLKSRCESDAGVDETLKRLEEVFVSVFGNKPTLVSFSGDDDAYKRFILAEQSAALNYEKHKAKTLSSFINKDQAREGLTSLAEVEPIPWGDEAFITPGDVAYCTESVDVSNTPSFKSGRWAIAKRAATYDYLWNNVRIKGGAYGVGFTEWRIGIADFYSYRDPNIDDTFNYFNSLGTWLSELNFTNDVFDGYVIAATGEYDKPSRGLERLKSQSRSYLLGLTLEDRERRRQEIVSCTIDDVRQLGKELAECDGKRCSVVFAGRELIEKSERSFVIREVD